MTRISGIFVSVALTALVSADAAAQWNVARFDSGQKQVYTTFGLDPALVTSVGLASVGRIAGRNIQISGEVGVVTAKVDTRDFRSRLGFQTSLLSWRSLNLTGSAMAITRGTKNSVYEGINFGADFGGTVGWYRPRWFAAYGGGYDKSVITHVTHTDWYRTHFYPDAKDGWYLNAGGTKYHGVSGGVTLGRAELMGRVGLLRTEDYNRMLTPAYASVGIGFGL